VAVGDNSLERLVSDLRTALDPVNRRRFIRNVARRGYVFEAGTTPVPIARAAFDLRSFLAADRAWGDGLLALESMNPTQLQAARDALEPLTRRHPDEPRFLVVLALVCALLYDSTRADPHPDVAVLARARAAALAACALNPDLIESCATLGFVLERTGDRQEALDAMRRAWRLDRRNWFHASRLATMSWGQERLGAVRDALALNPGFTQGYLLAAMVWVARQLLTEAERDIDRGIAAMAVQTKMPAPYAPIALYYVKGLLCLRRDDTGEAIEWFDREIDLEPRGHLYGRECCANAWWAKGVCFLIGGDPAAARTAFTEAMARIAHHPMACAGIEMLDKPSSPEPPSPESSPEPSSLLFERKMARAALLVDAGDVAGAVALLENALLAAPPGNAGWLIPIDPMLRVWEHPEAWAPVLAILRERAF
jgi:tetratricopeptide (TPR) repeat protein